VKDVEILTDPKERKYHNSTTAKTALVMAFISKAGKYPNEERLTFSNV